MSSDDFSTQNCSFLQAPVFSSLSNYQTSAYRIPHLPHNTRRMNKSNETVPQMFSDIMIGAVFVSIIPAACVSLVTVRIVTKTAVQRVMASFNYEVVGNEVHQLGGMVSGTDAAVVVPIPADDKNMVRRILLAEYELFEEQVDQRLKATDKCYGIVEGNIRHKALLHLMENDPNKWGRFSWQVMCLRQIFPLPALRQFARAQNMRHRSSYYVEMVLSDFFTGLHDEYERLKAQKNGTSTTVAEVSNAFIAAVHDKSDSTIRQYASTVKRIPRPVIDIISTIMNEEHPKIVQAMSSGNLTSLTEQQIIQQLDCRVFRNFITIGSLRLATNFMNAYKFGKYGINLQINY